MTNAAQRAAKKAKITERRAEIKAFCDASTGAELKKLDHLFDEFVSKINLERTLAQKQQIKNTIKKYQKRIQALKDQLPELDDIVAEKKKAIKEAKDMTKEKIKEVKTMAKKSKKICVNGAFDEWYTQGVWEAVERCTDLFECKLRFFAVGVSDTDFYEEAEEEVKVEVEAETKEVEVEAETKEVEVEAETKEAEVEEKEVNEDLSWVAIKEKMKQEEVKLKEVNEDLSWVAIKEKMKQEEVKLKETKWMSKVQKLNKEGRPVCHKIMTKQNTPHVFSFVSDPKVSDKQRALIECQGMNVNDYDCALEDIHMQRRAREMKKGYHSYEAMHLCIERKEYIIDDFCEDENTTYVTTEGTFLRKDLIVRKVYTLEDGAKIMARYNTHV